MLNASNLEHCFKSSGDKGAQQQSLIKQKMQSITSLELYALINPILFWFDFTIESPERLQLFKTIWRTLNRILETLPKKKIGIDIVGITLPVLHKVDTYMQQSSPQLPMLGFLDVVFSDFLLLPKISAPLRTFLEKFLVTFSKMIPHGLHEEAFGVCQ